MTATSTLAAPPGQSYDVKFRIRPLPILVTIVLGLGLPILAAVLLQLAGHYSRFLPTPDGPTLPGSMRTMPCCSRLH